MLTMLVAEHSSLEGPFQHWLKSGVPVGYAIQYGHGQNLRRFFQDSLNFSHSRFRLQENRVIGTGPSRRVSVAAGRDVEG